MINIKNYDSCSIGVIGLGYVGLPLAMEFSRVRNVIAYDINEGRISDLCRYYDSTMEVDFNEFNLNSISIKFTKESRDLIECNVFIITVPTPVDIYNKPDLTPLINASKLVGNYLKRGDLVIYESTVYPGCTEDICAKILANTSGLSFNFDFFVGYSPERVNPGDKQHRLIDIKKVTAGSTKETAIFVDRLYNEIILAGTHKAGSIMVAEAAKVIENTQRDLNIALINEIAIICNLLEIDTEEVLKAAGTKWNFLPFRPGLVGGHCIGVDPYYLTHKAESMGYHPELILSGRRINDSMGKYLVSQFLKIMIPKKINLQNARVLVMGFTFKENCPDIRNTKVIDIILELKKYGIAVDIWDPWANQAQMQQQYGLEITLKLEPRSYDGIILAVAHNEIKELGEKKIRSLGKTNHVLYDIKYCLDKSESDLRL